MMKKVEMEHKLFNCIKELAKILRLFQQEAIFCEGVTFTQFTILDLVAQEGTLKLSDLHRLLSVEKSTTTRLVDPIVKQNLLEKVSSNEDPRAVVLQITKAGKEVHKSVWDCISEFMQGILSEVPKGKSDDLIEILGMFVKAFNSYCNCGCNTKRCS